MHKENIRNILTNWKQYMEHYGPDFCNVFAGRYGGVDERIAILKKAEKSKFFIRFQWLEIYSTWIDLPMLIVQISIIFYFCMFIVLICYDHTYPADPLYFDRLKPQAIGVFISVLVVSITLWITARRVKRWTYKVENSLCHLQQIMQSIHSWQRLFGKSTLLHVSARHKIDDICLEIISIQRSVGNGTSREVELKTLLREAVTEVSKICFCNQDEGPFFARAEIQWAKLAAEGKVPTDYQI